MEHILIEKLKKEIREITTDAVLDQVGVVVKVSDGVAEIEGLSRASMGEMIFFDGTSGKNLEHAVSHVQKIPGLILNLEEDFVKAIILGDTHTVYEGMHVLSTGTVLSIPVGEELVGRVVSPLGVPLDGRGAIVTKTTYPIERPSHGVMERQSVNTPLHTGIKAIDSMIPIGRGQRELIIGDRYTGKTTLAIDTILNQKNEPEKTRPICIYVSIGQKESKTAQLVELLRERGAMEYTIVVNAGAGEGAALQYLAPFAGAAIGEYFMERGQDALVVYDDLSKHAVAYRQISLLLRRPPGREAYPGDIFYLHSRLLERAARLSKEAGGGSLTALPIIETLEGDVSAYVPTNVISITDGQIYLETDLFNKGIRPAINPGISVSRVGSAAQTGAMKKVSGKIRLELAQFRELEAFMQFAQDLDEDTKKRIDQGERLFAVLGQQVHKPLSFSRQVLLFYAVMNGYLASVSVSDIGRFEELFLSYVDREHPTLVPSIERERALTGEIEAETKKALAEFFAAHPFSV